MGSFALPFGNRKVAETYIQKEVKDVVENCAGIGVPVLLEIRVQQRNPNDPKDRSVDVDLRATWA